MNFLTVNLSDFMNVNNEWKREHGKPGFLFLLVNVHARIGIKNVFFLTEPYCPVSVPVSDLHKEPSNI